MHTKSSGNSSSFWKQFSGRFWIAILAICLVAVGLTACFESGSGSSADSGEVVIGLTDAESNFVKYEVDVVSLTLTKANGAVVDALPLATRVDFAQYVEMTEFLTVATVPVGRYIKATLTLDYQSADIQAENADGNAVPVETMTDSKQALMICLVGMILKSVE